MTTSCRTQPIITGATWIKVRSKHASYALSRYCERSDSSDQAMLADLISDLCHWCDQNKVDFKPELRKGIRAYRKESKG